MTIAAIAPAAGGYGRTVSASTPMAAVAYIAATRDAEDTSATVNGGRAKSIGTTATSHRPR